MLLSCCMQTYCVTAPCSPFPSTYHLLSLALSPLTSSCSFYPAPSSTSALRCAGVLESTGVFLLCFAVLCSDQVQMQWCFLSFLGLICNIGSCMQSQCEEMMFSVSIGSCGCVCVCDFFPLIFLSVFFLLNPCETTPIIRITNVFGHKNV